jgi:hypothetical protein
MRSDLSASIEHTIADAKANTVWTNAAECELRPLLVFHIDQPNLQIIPEREIHSSSRRDHKISASRHFVGKSEVAYTDQSFDVGSVGPCAKLDPWPNEVGGLADVWRSALFQPSALRLEASLPYWIDVGVNSRTLNFLLSITRFEKGVSCAHRDIGAGRRRSG